MSLLLGDFGLFLLIFIRLAFFFNFFVCFDAFLPCFVDFPWYDGFAVGFENIVDFENGFFVDIVLVAPADG